MSDTKKQRVLREAVDRMGRDAVATGLNVPLNLLEAWLNGHATMPDRKFLGIADLLERPKRK